MSISLASHNNAHCYVKQTTRANRSRPLVCLPACSSGRRAAHRCAALPDGVPGALDIKQLSDIITSTSLDNPEQQHGLESLAKELGVPLASVKNMAFRQKGLLSVEAGEVRGKLETIANVVEVPYEQARQMAVIQPSLLTDTQRMAEALAAGLKRICYDLKAPKEEIVELIIANPSLLHGRQMRLSVADMAHLALLREPKGRIASD